MPAFAQDLPVSAVPSSHCPRKLYIVGRHPEKQNGDICGEYICTGARHGRAVYQKPETGMAIRWWPPMSRWLIDREGVREAEVCVAYADDTRDCEHPAQTDLVWHIWDPVEQHHVRDMEVMAVDAPPTLTLVGRGQGREHSSANGEYQLTGACHGNPLYSKRCGDYIICYQKQRNCWMLTTPREFQNNNCFAFAFAGNTRHPGHNELQWNVHESSSGGFVHDPAVQVVQAPGILHIIGRDPQVDNARINGTYHLAGVRDGRPLYVMPGTRHVIRYSAKHDWWLIDCDGLAQPSWKDRLYQWLLDGESGNDRCCAYARACGATHPGHVALEWQVWDTRRSQHIPDPCVRSVIAPLVVQVVGRDAHRENSDINGEYMLSGTQDGHPAYCKPGSNLVIRFFRPSGRWGISREGLQNTDSCVAFADIPDSQHPAEAGIKWNVFEASRGLHLADPNVSVEVPGDAPIELLPRVPVVESSPLAQVSRAPQTANAGSAAVYGGQKRKVDVALGDAAYQQPGFLPPAIRSRGNRRFFGIFGA